MGTSTSLKSKMKANTSYEKSEAEKRTQRKNFWAGLLYLSPALIITGIFLFYPMFRTLHYSFFITTPGGIPLEFVGLENYQALWESQNFRTSMRATFLFALMTVPGTIFLSLFLAILTNERVKGIPFFRVVFSSTLGVSVAAGATIWLLIFHPSLGVLNSILNSIGLGSVQWLTSPNVAIISVAITVIWMNIGFNYIVLLGGLQNISEELYESAKIDGASYWKLLFKITIPLLSPTLFFVSVVTITLSFQTFGQVDILTGGGPSYSTTLIVYSIFREAFYNGYFGFASAQAIVLFLLVLLFTFIQFKVGEKRVHYQ